MSNKKVIIFWNECLNEQRGGIHRVILLLLKHLPSRGFGVQYLYTLDDYKTFHVYNSNQSMESIFGVDDLKSYIVDNKCDIVLGQDAVCSKLTRLIKEFDIAGLKIINEHHCSFLHLPRKLNYNYLMSEFKQSSSFAYKWNLIVKFLFYPLWKKQIWKNVSKLYEYNLLHSDIFLMLTDREASIARSILNGRTGAELMAIPNPLSWEQIENESILSQKRKEVLVVSRIYNPEKRIDFVLKIWNELQKRGVSKDWILRIVGDGVHREMLMKMARKMQLKNVIWEGWSDPKPFYHTASIFMMTSVCEGWGLTLTESMQTGGVPIAINTYPALNDIIADGFDGYIINGYNVKLYANKMQELMQNNTLRESIAKNALASCKRFSTEIIMDKWAEMLHSI